MIGGENVIMGYFTVYNKIEAIFENWFLEMFQISI